MKSASAQRSAPVLPPTRMLKAIAAATGSSPCPGNSFELLQNGDEIFPAMIGAIQQARSHIEFVTYVFWRSRIAAQLAEALAERARAGVKVRVLIDAVGGATLDARTIWRLERAGVQLAWFRPGLFRQLHRFNSRTHRKILLVDGQIGFTGGVGIADMWTGSAQDSHHWRETHCRIAGPACADLHVGFAENWREATGENLQPPNPEPAGKVSVHTIISTAGTHPTVAEQVLHAITANVQRRLWITTGYFIPTDPVIDALTTTARRGVDVRVLTNGRHNDHPVAMMAGRFTYEKLLRAGVKIYEYDRTMHHAKIITADGAWATIGSINLDPRSLILNDELNVAVTDPGLVSALDLQFLEDLKESKHIRGTHWYQRGRLARLIETGAGMFRHQL